MKTTFGSLYEAKQEALKQNRENYFGNEANRGNGLRNKLETAKFSFASAGALGICTMFGAAVLAAPMTPAIMTGALIASGAAVVGMLGSAIAAKIADSKYYDRTKEIKKAGSIEDIQSVKGVDLVSKLVEKPSNEQQMPKPGM